MDKKQLIFIAFTLFGAMLFWEGCHSTQKNVIYAPTKNTKGFEERAASGNSPAPTNMPSPAPTTTTPIITGTVSSSGYAQLGGNMNSSSTTSKKTVYPDMLPSPQPKPVIKSEPVVSNENGVQKIAIPPVYETRTEQVPVTRWEKGKKDPNALSANPDDARVMCLVVVPGEYTTVTKQVVKEPAKVMEIRPSKVPGGLPDTVIVEEKPKEPVTGEQYEPFIENEFLSSSENPFSTFSIDADGAAYTNIKRYVMDYHQKPPQDAVRLEEMINYFSYDYPNPKDKSPIFVDGEVSSCPWDNAHKLVRIGFKGKNYATNQKPYSNLVFLIDVSGSMSEELRLVKKGLEMLVNELSPDDKVAIVTYAGADRLELDATPVKEKEKILKHLRGLKDGGSTNGAKGILTAYEIASKHFVPYANNRVVLVTDGDFNVGVSSREDLIKLIEKQRESGVFLSVLGCGTGNYNDAGLEALADHGNGIYEYLNKEADAQKIFVEEFDKFFTVAKDVKIQIEFNPEIISDYRLIGYENRKLNKEDFANDKKDAGDLSAGQSLTALYEVIPTQRTSTGKGGDIRSLQINFRYKEPSEDKSKLISIDVVDKGTNFENASENLRFAAAVASSGMLLRDSKFKGTTSYAKVKEWADKARNYDKNGYRSEFLKFVEAAEALK
ncbi:MAG: vWA domain-containing protein [Bacteroidia bacterium]